MSDRLLAWYGRERYERELAAVQRFWAGEGAVAVSITPGARFRGNQRASDEQRYVDHLAGLERQAALPGWNLPSVYPDWGTVSEALYWGCREVTGVDAPYVEPAAETLEEAERIEPASFDDPTLHVARALALHERLSGALQTEALWLRGVDAQGPLNLAAQVLRQEELLMAIAAEPERVMPWLVRLGDWFIELQRHHRQRSGGRVTGSIWPYTFLPPSCGVAVTEDMMPLLSAAQYERVGIPLLRRIEAALGPLHIHCCGRWGHHVPALAASGLRFAAFEFHHPFTTLEELAPLRDRAVLVPYIALDHQQTYANVADYYRALVRRVDEGYRFWFAFCDDEPATVALAEELLAAAG